MNPRLTIFPLVAVAFIVLMTVGGCRSSTSNHPPLAVRLYLETKPGEPGVPVRLPVSGVTIDVGAKPVLVEYDVVDAEVVRAELGRCLRFHLSPAASRDLYRLSVVALGRRLVLSLNGTLVGAQRIDRAMDDGTIMIFAELPDEQLPGLVSRIRQTSVDIAVAAKRK